MAGFSQGASRSSKALLETHSFKKSVSRRTFKILTVAAACQQATHAATHLPASSTT
jgi:hypothetical protein